MVSEINIRINFKAMKKVKSVFVVLVMAMFFCEFTYAQDWPGLNRYRNENEKIGLPVSGENRVVFMGNSITDVGPSTLEMIEDNILSMAQLAKANDIKVVLCSVLPVFDYPWKRGIEPADKIIALNKMLKSDAEKGKMIYVDIFSAMVDERKGMKAEYSGDGVHPNDAGYKVMEPLVENAIAKALHKKK